MSDRVEVFDVTVTAGTAKGSGIQDISFSRAGIVVGVEVVIPDGVNGVAGFALLAAHTQQIPFKSGQYVTGNNEVIRWALTNQIQSGSWQFDGFNNGNYPHTFEIRFLVNEPNVRANAQATQGAVQQLDLSGIGSYA